MTLVSVKQALAGAVAEGARLTVRGLGANPARLQGGAVLRSRARRLVLLADPGRRAESSLPNYSSEVLHLTSGASVVCRGCSCAPRARDSRFEIKAERVEVVGFVDDPETYPIQPKAHSLEYLREVAHLRPRTNTFGAVTRVRHTIAQAIHRYFHERGFVWITTPDHHRQRLRGRRPDVPRLDARSGESAAHAARARSTGLRTSSARRRS